MSHSAFLLSGKQFFFLCLSIQWDPTGYCKIVNKGAWLGGCVNQSLQSWPCVRAYGSIPTVINASMNAASVTAGGAGACSQHSSSVSWAGTAGACSWELCELLRAFLKLVKCSSLPLSLTYFWRDWAVEEGWIFCVCVLVCSWISQRQIYFGRQWLGGDASHVLSGFVGVWKRRGRSKQAAPALWLETAIPERAAAEKLSCATQCGSA